MSEEIQEKPQSDNWASASPRVIDAIGRNFREGGPAMCIGFVLLILLVLAARLPPDKLPDCSHVSASIGWAWGIAGILGCSTLFCAGALGIVRRTYKVRIVQLAARIKAYEEQDPKMTGRPSSLTLGE